MFSILPPNATIFTAQNLNVARGTVTWQQHRRSMTITEKLTAPIMNYLNAVLRCLTTPCTY